MKTETKTAGLAPMTCCPRCGRTDITTYVTSTYPKTVDVVTGHSCRECGPVKASDRRETVTSTLQGLS